MAEKSLSALISELMADRDSLRIKLKYSQSAIEELQRQNRRLDLLLSDASQLIKKHVPAMNAGPKVVKSEPRKYIDAAQTTWIGGTWLETGLPELTFAEKCWLEGNTQEALSLVSQLVSCNTASPLSIEANLFLSALVRTNGNSEQGLLHAKEALRQAKESDEIDQNLLGKAHFHMGLCCLHLTMYADASWNFTLAKSTKGHELEVEANWEVAELNRLRYDSTDSRRVVLSDC